MSEKEIISDANNKMNVSIEVFQSDLDGINVGRASPAFLNGVLVNVYGSKKKLSEIGQVRVVDARTLALKVWDNSILNSVIKGLNDAQLGLSPMERSGEIFLAFPDLSAERRKELDKMVQERAEKAKISIRSIRTTAKADLVKLEKAKSISEDVLKQSEDELQKITDNMVVKITEIAKKKSAEILKV